MFGLEHLTESIEEGAEHGSGERRPSDGGVGRERSNSLEAPLLSPDEEKQALELLRRDVVEIQKEVTRLSDSLARNSREDVDEVIHALQYRADKAKRRLDNPGPLEEANVARMMVHLAELKANCESMSKPIDLPSAKKSIDDFEKTLNHLHGHAHRNRFRRWKQVAKPPEEKTLSEKLPWALAFAVTVDASVDGLLIGLAFSASESAGWCMSVATCIEMGFLGLSFSASVQNATRSFIKHSLLVVVPPLVLAGSGLMGRQLGHMLEETPGLFVGFIAFSIVALLFLVTQELLTEAREVAGEDMTTNIMFFVGLLGGILLEKLLG